MSILVIIDHAHGTLLPPDRAAEVVHKFAAGYRQAKKRLLTLRQRISTKIFSIQTAQAGQ